MTQITNAPDAQQPFVNKQGFITRAWFQWLLQIIGTATTGGTVTHTGALTSGKTIVGNGADDIKVSTLTATVVKSASGTLSAASAGTDYTALAFKTIAVSGQSDIVADSAADLLTVAAGSGVTLTTNASTDTLTIAATGSGGTVTHTGNLDANHVVLGNGTADVTELASLGTTTTVLHGNAGGAPSFGSVDLANDVTGNLGVSHLNSGTSASATTFWRGDGAWANPSAGGGLVYHYAVCSGDTTGTANVQVAVTGCSVTCAAGTWLVWGQVLILIDNSTYTYADIYDGSAIQSVAQTGQQSTVSTAMSIAVPPVVLTFGGPTTLSLRFATGLAGVHSIAKQTFAGATPTTIFALQVA